MPLPKNLRIDIPEEIISESDLIEKNLETDILISTSIKEGFGIPILDALNFNLFCVVTDIEPFREIKKTYKGDKLFTVRDKAHYDAYIEVVKSLMRSKFDKNYLSKARSYKKMKKEINLKASN